MIAVRKRSLQSQGETLLSTISFAMAAALGVAVIVYGRGANHLPIRPWNDFNFPPGACPYVSLNSAGRPSPWFPKVNLGTEEFQVDTTTPYRAKPKDVAESDLAKVPVLGMDRNSVIKLCGKPLEEKILQPGDPILGGITWMRFQAGDYRLIVEIAPNTKKVVQIYHFRKRPFTDSEIAGLLERNAQGHQWKGEKFAWKRSDGASARGGVNQGAESQIVVVDPSWNKQP